MAIMIKWIYLQPSGSNSQLRYHYIINNNKQLKRTAGYNYTVSKYISKENKTAARFKKKNKMYREESMYSFFFNALF